VLLGPRDAQHGVRELNRALAAYDVKEAQTAAALLHRFVEPQIQFG